jgi:small subunit ribosomal protein S8
MTDPIADLLTRMRNGGMANHETVDVPWSRLKESIAEVLVEEGYVRQIRRIQVDGQVQDTLRIHLKYDRNGQPVMSELKRVSRPGRRVYLGYKDIQPVRKGLGTHILSTPKGIVVDREAVKAKVGGELLCSVS